MSLPGEIGRQYRLELHEGAGCCSPLNSWRREPLVDRTSAPSDDAVIVSMEMQHLLAALASQFISGDAMALALYSFKDRLISSGWTEARADIFIRKCASYFNNNRSGFTEKFIG